MQIIVKTKDKSYPVYIEKNLLKILYQKIPLRKKMAIVTDNGIPSIWKKTLKKQFPSAYWIEIQQGEASKNLKNYQKIMENLLEHSFTRKDILIALGGGVVGDLSGFVASTYMRGIPFYSIPTTVLSQVDASVGGKTAINYQHYKNMIGSFYQPEAVFIDLNILQTLPARQKNNGLIEALKMGLLMDRQLFSWFEEESLPLEKIIPRSIQLKKMIVEQDEKESHLRMILNFGHTIGHAIEAQFPYLHGECVSMGMLYFIQNSELKKRVLKIYEKLNMPKIPDFDVSATLEKIRHDKKSTAQGVQIVQINQIGSYQIKTLTFAEIEKCLKGDPYEK